MTLTTNEVSLQKDTAGGGTTTIEVGQPTSASAGFDEHPGYIPNRSYPVYYGTMVASSEGALASYLNNAVVMTPIVIKKPLVLTGIEVFVYSGGTGSAFKGAVYANQNGRPYGAPLAKDDTGVATATSQTDTKSPMAVTLSPGVYWVAQKHNLGTAAPTCVCVDNPNLDFASLIGMAGAYKSPTLSIYATSLYTDPWPTFDGTETWTENTNANGAPLPWLRT